MQQQIPYSPPPFPLWSLISVVLSIIALGIACLSLYLQRRDRKPRLKIRLEHFLIPVGTNGAEGKPVDKPTHIYEIIAANVGDKPIKIAHISFEPIGIEGFPLIVYGDVPAVPSHEASTIFLREVYFRNELQQRFRNAKGRTGRVIIVDELENEHKSDWINMPNLLLEP